MLALRISAALLTLIATTTADFFISNTTVCHGVPTKCPRGAQVITASLSPYNCDVLVPAQDNAYLRNGTMGPFGDWQLFSDNICPNDNGRKGNGRITLLRRAEDDGYDVRGEDGDALGTCTETTDTLAAACDLWITGIMFRSIYKCSSPVCGA